MSKLSERLNPNTKQFDNAEQAPGIFLVTGSVQRGKTTFLIELVGNHYFLENTPPFYSYGVSGKVFSGR